MSEIVLNADVRTATGKKSKILRAAGKIPGVFYAHGEENIAIEVPATTLAPLVFTHETHIVQLTLNDGTVKKCILRDVQFDPVSDQPVHFDLQGVRENEKLMIEIPVALTGGIPVGVRAGGMLQHIIHRLKVSCFPRDIPEKIEINVGELAINQFVHVKDLALPNVTILENAEASVVGVLPPTVEKPKEAEAVEAAPAEPEVVGKGKKAEEGEEEGEKEKEKEKEKK